MNRWLVALLVISLMLNLGIVGFMAGRATGGPPPAPPGDPTLGFRHMLRDLPEQRRSELAPVMRPHVRHMLPNLRGMRRSQEALREALLAEPFDPATLESALSEFREHLLNSQVASHEGFVTMVSAMTPEERAALAQSLQRPRRSARAPHPG